MSLRKNFDLVIFDCDGVLVDSEIISVRAQADALRNSGFGILESELIARFTGVPDADMYQIIQAEAGRSLPADHDTRVKAAIAAAYDLDLAAIPGVREATDAIDVAICVASSSTPEKLEHGLRVTGLLARFSPYVFSASMVARGKPAPDLFLYAAQQMGVPPEACIVIEDSIAGVIAGVNAGMIVIGFDGGSHCCADTGTKLLEAGAVSIISHMAGLSAAIAECSAR
jgi:HAD superfamily hydrolase (TIGR01509 family)